MTALLVEDTPSLRSHPVAPATETLEALVTRTWADLRLKGHAVCPMCGAGMRTLDDAGGAGPIGHCAACDSELS